MKSFPQSQSAVNQRAARIIMIGALLLILTQQITVAAPAPETSKTFATPEEAANALLATVKTHDPEALKSLFGPAVSDLENPDRVQATNELSTFAIALEEKSQIVRESSSRYVLEVGTNEWPFPIPIALREGRWLFDTAAGKEELLNRRIGRNELAVLEVMRAYVDAQRDYASRDRDGDEVLEYAQRLSSTPGTQDGLYWPLELWGEVSPLGPLVAHAQGEGYHLDEMENKEPPQAFHGYYFKIVTRQGKHAAGGKYDYIINGNMIGGFAMVAWPAEYGDSGVMTFIVNQQGTVWQKDLGPKTQKLLSKLKEYDPDSTWERSPD